MKRGGTAVVQTITMHDDFFEGYRTRSDFIEALLASSAFPAAFAPRRDSALYPGLGRLDIFYGDGGLFDNLPFLPAYQALGRLQKARLRPSLGKGRWRDELVQRHQFPDLCLVGALDVQVGQSDDLPDKAWDTLDEIMGRASQLANNEKIYGFESSARLLDMQLGKYASAAWHRAADEGECVERRQQMGMGHYRD